MSAEEKPPKVSDDIDEEEEEEEEDEYLEEYDEDDEDDEDEDEDDEDDEDEDDELTDLLANTLLTPDGDTLCGTLVRISNTLETQNKILIKLLSALAKR